MIFYHRTMAEAAKQILYAGFRDGVAAYLTTQEHRGVWLSNLRLDINEGAEGDVLLEVELPDEQVIAKYDWIEGGKPYREWLVPAV